MDILALIARDPSVSLAYRRVVANPKSYLEDAADKAEQRRFLEEPHTHSAFAPMDADRCAEIRADEHADHVRDVQRERDGGAE